MDRRVAAFRRWITPRLRDPPAGFSWPEKHPSLLKQEIDDAVISFINHDFSYPGYEDWDIQ